MLESAIVRIDTSRVVQDHGLVIRAVYALDPSEPISSIADEPTAWVEISDPYELVPVESIIGFYISPRCQSSPKLSNLKEKEEN